MKFDHIGVFVPSLDLGRKHLENIFQISNWTNPVNDHLQKVSVQFGLDLSGLRYELVAPLGNNNPVDPLLKQSKNILNHVAYLVDDLDVSITRLKKERCLLISKPTPAIAFNNRRIAFLYTPLHFVIELIEN